MGIKKKKTDNQKESNAQPSDLEIAKKMLKIYQSALDRKLDYNLSFETVKKLMSYKNCYYTGKEFESEGMYSMSFDRVDSAKGYIEGNVVSCTVDINGKKSNLSIEEIKSLYEKLVPKTKREEPIKEQI
jgi:hypothetical protein